MIKNVYCGYLLEPPRRGGSNEYPRHVLSRSMKNIRIFIRNFRFFGGKTVSIFEQACFRNDLMDVFKRLEQV